MKATIQTTTDPVQKILDIIFEEDEQYNKWLERLYWLVGNGEIVFQNIEYKNNKFKITLNGVVFYLTVKLAPSEGTDW